MASPARTLKKMHGTLIGGASGFMLGGPLGALLGSALGHAYDRTRRALFGVESAYLDIVNDGMSPPLVAPPQPPSRAAHETAFTIGIIALGAKLARLDRRLDRDTIEAFRTAFRLPPTDIPLIRKMFEQALFDSVGHKPYADQLASIFATRRDMLADLVAGLVRFAKAEGEGITPAVLDYLESLSKNFQLPKEMFEQILAVEGMSRIVPPRKQTPFEILGVAPGAPEVVVKQVYRGLIKECHPDRLRHTNIEPEALAAANDRIVAINAAYAEIKRAKGWA